MNQKNDKGLAHGYWEYYWDNECEHIMGKGHFNNGEYYGVWEWYYFSGNLQIKEFRL